MLGARRRVGGARVSAGVLNSMDIVVGEWGYHMHLLNWAVALVVYVFADSIQRLASFVVPARKQLSMLQGTTFICAQHNSFYIIHACW